MAYPTIPHFTFPFTFNPATGQINVTQQDSDDDIMACANVIARTPIGMREDRPEFGWPMPDLSLIPIDASPLVNALAQFEPRIEQATIVETANDLATGLAGQGIQDIDLNLSVLSNNLATAASGAPAPPPVPSTVEELYATLLLSPDATLVAGGVKT